MLFQNFKLKETSNDVQNVYFFGLINNVPAIYIFPFKKINNEEFFKISNEKNELINQNDIYYVYSTFIPLSFKYRLVYPATTEHLIKYNSKMIFKKETYAEYLQQSEKMSLNWIKNIFEGKTNEKIYYQDECMVLINNYKWDGLNVNNIQLLIIFKNSNLKSIRDLDSVELLYNAKNIIIQNIKNFGLTYNDIVCFFHYKPTYDHLHLHICNINLEGDPSMSVTRARLLEDVIYNIELDKNYYKRDIWHSMKKN